MARPLRLLVHDGIYHVFSRTLPGLSLYEDDDDRQYFMQLVSHATAARGWACLAYCLMTTHFHLIVRTPEADLSQGMHRVLGAYASHVHRRREGSRGPIFSGRYGSELVTSDAQFAEVLRYVALNPVRSGSCVQPSAWAWSSHRALAGEERPGLVAVREVHDRIEGMTGRGGPDGYLALVRQAVGAEHVSRTSARGRTRRPAAA